MEEKENKIQEALFKISNKKQREEIEIYHDEGYENNDLPFIHQFVAIPVRSRSLFYKLLEEIRKKYKGEELSIKWSKINKGNKSRNKVSEEWLRLLSAASYKEFRYINARREPIIEGPLGIKVLSVFINSLDDLSDEFYSDSQKPAERRRRKYESLMYMGIKGLTSFCFNPEYTTYSGVIITRLCTDGENGGIPIDSNRVIRKLGFNVRDYVKIKASKIEGIPKSKVKTPEVDFEEVADLVLGSTRYLCGHETRSELKDKITKPLRDVYSKAERSKEGREASGHYRAFSVSKYMIDENDRMNFKSLYPAEDNSNNVLQKSLNL